ncbi:N-acetylglutamate synthase, GNAT family [Arenibacter nanhaiticus]|uniref:N-acetylglutamate synthase, GNAT family n=1 Tax=Arenibacter nanhaiticus TaxID=558155 RepID=A0A1M6CW74_9FLAO|nr:GNAT family N-acetyltransferase [Arenibacter nanhaiticus]SHI65257.1 N-acetylglutamate synthase, GNAT family [Arenibacter nanhaiticus]
MIRRAKKHEITDILGITNSCAEDMIKKGIFQWNKNYPSREAFERDLDRNELYVLEKNEIIIGCIVISDFMDKEYIPIHWDTPNTKNMYIHRLAVHPDHQGKGYASLLMDFAEDLAKTHNFLSIRLDTLSKNKRNISFYTARGYQQKEDIYFPHKSEFPFHCYELVL